MLLCRSKGAVKTTDTLLIYDHDNCWSAGKKLDKKVEQGIMASGVLLLTLVAVVLVVRDTLNLSSGKSFM